MTRSALAALLALVGMAAAALMPPVPEPPGVTRPAAPHHWQHASH